MNSSIKYPLFIDGVASTNNYQKLFTPFSDEEIAEVEKTDEAALEKALQNAEKAFKELMQPMPAYQRAEILYKVSKLIEQNHAELSRTIALEGGKPLKDAKAEVSRAINTVKMCGDEALQLNGETITMDRSAGSEKHLAFTRREPVGVVFAISAFNHPLNLACHQICPAIAAGNAVIFKPASQTPLSSLKLARFFIEAGLPAEALSIITASGSETETVVKDHRINYISFIGSEAVGWNLQKIVSPGVRIALEHGGTGTAILHSDADINKVLPSIVRGAFYHAGQVCVSTQNLFVHEDIYDDVVSKLKAGIALLKTGDPTHEETDVGPLINPKEVERVDAWVQEALKDGATLECGGKIMKGNCYAPTLLTGVTKKMRLFQHEIFGPVLSVVKYSDIKEPIDIINASDYSFQAAIYTQDIDRALAAANSISAKAVMVNDTTAFRVDWMPFGGKKHSGAGVGGTRHATLEMTDEKLTIIKVG